MDLKRENTPEKSRASWKLIMAGGCLGIVVGAAALLAGLLIAYGFYQQKAVKKMAEVKELKPVHLRADYGWTAKGVDGTTLSLESLKGKPVFLHLWRPGCVSCVAEIPGINALYNTFAEKGMQFVSIALESGKDLNADLQVNGVEFPVYTVEGNKLPAAFPATATPTTYIIDKAGFIVYSETGAVDWNSEDGRAFLESLCAQ